MKHYTPSFTRRNVRAYFASLLSYLLLAGQMTPLVLAAKSPAPRVAPPTDVARESAAQAPPLQAAAAPAPLAAAAAPIISATKVDAFADPNMDGKADPGQTISYTVTITNTGPDPATNLTFTDTVDPNTTLQPGTVIASPIAADESYSVLGNVRIQPNAAAGLLANDINPNTGNTSGLTASGPTSSAQGGNVSVNADGSFSYDPPVGFTGTDSFTYTVTGNGLNDTAVATFNVSGMIFFVNDDDPTAGGDGRLSNPFNCLTGPGCFSESTADEAGDNIFLYAGSYTGGHTLLNTQKLIGEGATAALATIAGVTVPPHSDALPTTGGAAPVITNGTGNGINLAAGNLLRGLAFGNASGSAVNGAAVGALSVSETSINTTGQALNLGGGPVTATFSSVTSTGGVNNVNLNGLSGTLTMSAGALSGSTGTAFNVTGGNAAVTYSGNITNANGQRGVSVANVAGGSLNVGGTVTVSGTGAGNDAVVIDGNDVNAFTATINSVNINTNSMDDGIVLRDLVAGSAVTISGGSVTSNGAGRRVVDFEGENTAGTYNLSAVTFNNTSGDGFLFLAGQTGTYSFGATTANTPNGTNPVVAVTSSSAAITFASISEAGGTNGINLNGATGSFTSTTTTLGTNAARLTGTAVSLTNNSAPVNLGAVSIFSATGVSGTGNTGTFTATSGLINTLGGAALNITGPAGRTPLALTLGSITATNSTVQGVNLELVSGSVNVNGAGTPTNITNSTGVGLRLVNNTATFTFANTTSVTATNTTGVFLNANTAAITFADLDITPDSGERALRATTNSGTITTTSGTLLTTTGIPVEIAGTSSGARTPLNMTLTSVSSNGAPNGIVLTNTNGPGAAVGFSLVGDGTTTTVGGNATGGSILNSAGADDDSPADAAGTGVRLVDADEVTLRRLTVTTSANYGLYGERATNVTFEFSRVNGTNGTDSPGGGINNINNPDASVYFNELTGAALFKDAVIEGGLEDNVRIINTAGTLNRLTFTNVTVGVMDLGNARGDNAMFLQARNAAVMNVTIQDGDFTHARGDILQFDLTNTAAGDLVFDNNTVNNQHPNVVTGGGGVTISGGGSATANTNLTYEFDNNTFRGARGSALLIIMQTGAGSASGRIEGNTFGASGVNLSGSSEANTIEVRTEGRGAQTVLINNNQIRQYAAFGIYMEMDGINTGGSTGTIGNLNATITNNTIEQPNTAAVTHKNGIHLNHGATAGDSYVGCVDIRTNTTGAAGSETSIGQDIILRQRVATTVRLPGYAGTANDDNAVEVFIQGQNTGTESVSALSDFPATGGGWIGGAACTQAPAGPVTSEFIPAPDGPPPASAFGAVDVPTSTDNVTSRPFVSPMLLVKTGAAATAQQQRGAASAQSAQVRTKGEASSQTKGTAPAQIKRDTTTKPVGGADFDTPTMNPPVVMGDNITWNIGTLPAGGSVTIKFDVVVDNPFNGAQPQVSNQGTVTADGGISVLTDDPSVPGAADPTVTPILATNIVIRDAKEPEPPSGSANMVFTVTLSNASTSNVMVNFTTADEPPGPGKAVAGQDYTTTNGTLTFMPGQRVKTISVPVLSDADAGEPDETFLVQLSGAVGGTITDGTATGTITAANPPGTTLITELRTFGPGGGNDPNDEFVEIYNNTDSPVTVAASDASAGWAVAAANNGCDGDPVIVGVIPNGTVIPARGHFLLTGSAYSLANYGGTGAAAGNLTMSANVAANANVAVFSTSDIANLSSVNRLDAVGFNINVGGVCDLLREGTPATGPTTNLTLLGQYSVLRDPCGKGGNPNTFGGACPTTGNPQDLNANASDFFVVDPNGTNAGAGQHIGAAGPENLASPIRRDATIGVTLLDASVAAATPPNRVRDFTSDPANNSTQGTLSIRRRFVNNTGAPVTRLRFRIVDISTAGGLNPGIADLRARTAPASVSVLVNDPATCAATGTPATAPCMVPLLGTTLETPPAQPNGGGPNSSLSAGTITTGTPLAPGASINMQFLFGIQQTGSFKFFFTIEALP